MGYFKSLPDETNLSDFMQAYPKGWPELLEFHDQILRTESPLTIGQRELIAAYVSGLNRCRYCFNAHTMYAESFGIAGDVFEPLMTDPESAPVEEKMRPILAYARVLTLEPGKITQAHMDAILDAGWSEEAVADAVKVIALYNFMNRIIIGVGVDPHDAMYERRKAGVRKLPLEKRQRANDEQLGSQNYRNFGKQLGIIPKDA